MNPEELFVGGVAIALGALAVAAAIGNWDRCFQSAKVRWIETLGGRRTARAMYALVGIALIVLGVAIALGFGPNKSRRGVSQTSPRDTAPELSFDFPVTSEIGFAARRTDAWPDPR